MSDRRFFWIASVGLIFCAGLARAGEHRALWADAWHGGFHSAAETSALVNTAYENNFNVIIAEIRLRGDAFYFPTYPNTEPRHGGIGSYDAVADLVNKCHALGIELHAWIVNYPVLSPSGNSSPQHVANAHPEWLSLNSSGVVVGTEDPANPADKVLDPGVPAANLWNYNVCMDLVQHYDIDGLNLDYIRYPYVDSGYNPIAIVRFNQEYGRTGQPATNDATFSNWRRRQVTDYVKLVYLNAIAIKPDLKFTAAVFSSRSDAYNARYQDWASWMQTGIIDAICPMNYMNYTSTFRSRCNDAIAYSYNRHVYMDMGRYAGTIDEINYSRSVGCQGLQLYSYWTFTTQPDNMLPYVRDTVMPARDVVTDMPWKSAPTAGYVKGNITYAGTTIYNANIALIGSGMNTRSDGTGFYGFTNVPPDTYNLTASFPNYSSKTLPVTVAAGQVSTVDFQMELQDTPTVTPTPVPGSPYSVIIDNVDAGYSDSGGWTTSALSSIRYGIDYRYCSSATGAGRWAHWTPNLERSGDYFVSVWYPDGTNRATNSPFTVYYSGGSQTFPVNQQIAGGGWNVLGAFPFQAGSGGYVELTNEGLAGGSGVVIADAVQFDYVNPPTPTFTDTPTPVQTNTPLARGNFIQILGQQ